jgi:hypothetical protein
MKSYEGLVVKDRKMFVLSSQLRQFLRADQVRLVQLCRRSVPTTSENITSEGTSSTVSPDVKTRECGDQKPVFEMRRERRERSDK